MSAHAIAADNLVQCPVERPDRPALALTRELAPAPDAARTDPVPAARSHAMPSARS